MSKYDPLWEHIRDTDLKSAILSFSEIAEILGFEIDHSFLNYKKELLDYGFEIMKISLKDKTVFYARS